MPKGNIPHGLNQQELQNYTNTQIKTYLKSQGISGYSNRNKSVLAQIYLEHQRNMAQHGGGNIPKNLLNYTDRGLSKRNLSLGDTNTTAIDTPKETRLGDLEIEDSPEESIDDVFKNLEYGNPRSDTSSMETPGQMIANCQQ
jgi:hypothetical protein